MSSLFIGPHDAVLQQPDTILVDVTHYAPDEPLNEIEEFNARRLPGARFLSFEDLAQPNSDGFLLMLPDAERFSRFMGQLEITPDSRVVFYDQHGNNRASARAVLTFKTYGHDTVHILDGGLKRAIAEGIEIDENPPKVDYKPVNYPVPSVKKDFIIDYAELKASIGNPSNPKSRIMLDTRPPEDLELGLIPNVLSIPYTNLTRPPKNEQGRGYSTFLNSKEFRTRMEQVLGKEVFASIVNGERQVGSTCLVGITASMLWVLWLSIGVEAKIYDESWTGYNLREKKGLL